MVQYGLPKSVEVWVPHRISGFFQMMDPFESEKIEDPELIGSRGGGPALSAFIKTIIKIDTITNINEVNDTENENWFEIFINGKRSTKTAHTSSHVIESMKSLFKEMLGKRKLMVYHEIELPMGCGYGSSGGGALGISLCLNILFDLGLSIIQLSKYAHIAEVSNHTGLGTVGGQVYGGFSLSMEPGFPFKMDQICYSEDLRVVIASYGPVSTKSILTDPEYKIIIHNEGKKAMKNMKKSFSVQNFINTCVRFIDNTQILEKLGLSVISNLIKEINAISNNKNKNFHPFGASLNQLGRSVFCICNKVMVDDVMKVIKKYDQPNVLRALEINANGPIVKKIEF